jgi:hypothetical protein
VLCLIPAGTLSELIFFMVSLTSAGKSLDNTTIMTRSFQIHHKSIRISMADLDGVAVTLLTPISEVEGSNLDGNNGFKRISWFSSVDPDKCRVSTSIRPQPLTSKSIPSHDSSYYMKLDECARHSTAVVVIGF